MPSQPSIPRVCMSCQKHFMVRPDAVKYSGAKYCSRACCDASQRVHGEAWHNDKSSEYRTWQGMKKRCANPDDAQYANYGGRGVTVCDRWLTSFENFLEDMGRRPGPCYSIDRIDNAGAYSPENCRWATPLEQGRNKRTNRLLTHNGETHCVTEWAEIVGMPGRCLSSRLKLGWSVERALTTPLKRSAAARKEITMTDTDTPCTPGLAGTDDETYYLNSRGEWYLIQGAALGDLPYVRVSKPSAKAEELPWSASYDLDIPDEIR